jgi:hypothetical protein
MPTTFKQAVENLECENIQHIQWVKNNLTSHIHDSIHWDECPFTNYEYPIHEGDTFSWFVFAVMNKIANHHIETTLARLESSAFAVANNSWSFLKKSPSAEFEVNPLYD